MDVGLQTANSELSQWVILNKWVSNKCSNYASQLSLLEQAEMSSSASLRFSSWLGLPVEFSRITFFVEGRF